MGMEPVHRGRPNERFKLTYACIQTDRAFQRWVYRLTYYQLVMSLLLDNICKGLWGLHSVTGSFYFIHSFFSFLTCNPGLPSSTDWSGRNSKLKLLQIPHIHASFSRIFSFMSEARGWHSVPVASQEEDGAIWPSAPVWCPISSPSQLTLQPSTAGKRIQQCLEYAPILSFMKFMNQRILLI